MPIEERISQPANVTPRFQLGQPVVDSEGKMLGKVRARFSRYIMLERGGVFTKAYYIPHAAISKIENDRIQLALTTADLKQKEMNQMPDDLYEETPEVGFPDVSGVAQFGRGPLSPAQTGHYNYGRRSPGINTDASGSYHREEVSPIPQKLVRDTIFSTEMPLPSSEISPD